MSATSITARPLGAVLAALRATRRLSCNQLGFSADVDPSMVTRIERGNRHPSRAMVIRLAGALAATDDETDDLLIAAGYLPSSQGIRRLAASLLIWGNGRGGR